MSRLLVRAAEAWLRKNPPDLSVSLGTMGNGFILEAERAYFEALEDHIRKVKERDRPLPERAWGVYQLVDASDRVLYVGMTGSPQARVRTHLRELGDRIGRVLWTETGSKASAFDLETELIGALRPPMNIAKVPT